MSRRLALSHGFIRVVPLLVAAMGCGRATQPAAVAEASGAARASVDLEWPFLNLLISTKAGVLLLWEEGAAVGKPSGEDCQYLRRETLAERMEYLRRRGFFEGPRAPMFSHPLSKRRLFLSSLLEDDWVFRRCCGDEAEDLLLEMTRMVGPAAPEVAARMTALAEPLSRGSGEGAAER